MVIGSVEVIAVFDTDRVGQGAAAEEKVPSVGLAQDDEAGVGEPVPTVTFTEAEAVAPLSS